MQKFKKIIRATVWVLVMAALGVVFAFVQANENEILCSKVNMLIHRAPLQENFFVEENAIRSLIAHKFGQVENTSLKNIDVQHLEKIMYYNPWVRQADVYLSIDGITNIEIEQRQPVLRIINQYGSSYYIDADGKLMPWSPDFTSRSIIATGNIPETFERWKGTTMDELINNDTLKTQSHLDDLYTMTRFILADGFWCAFVEQLFINTNHEIEIVPKIGNYKIVFGDTQNMEDKFFKLKAIYQEGLKYTGWDKYDTLNLKYTNQVVCTKKKSKQNN
jgi:cell division protein FtsQ